FGGFSGGGRAGHHGDGSGSGHAPGLYQLLHEFGSFQDGELAELFNELFDIGHYVSPLRYRRGREPPAISVPRLWNRRGTIVGSGGGAETPPPSIQIVPLSDQPSVASAAGVSSDSGLNFFLMTRAIRAAGSLIVPRSWESTASREGISAIAWSFAASSTAPSRIPIFISGFLNSFSKFLMALAAANTSLSPVTKAV